MAAFDVVRGFSVVSMVLFHLCYDLHYLYGTHALWFRPPLQDVWRASISWTFLFVAGCMCSFSRNGWKRATRYLLVAAAVFLATTIAAVDVPISFGIIFCMGASTLIEALLRRLGLSPCGLFPAGLFFALFLCSRQVPLGSISFAGWSCALPRTLYATPYLSFLGFPGPGFASGDYYPIIPFTLMYLVGVSVGAHLKDRGYPEWLLRLSCPPLEWIGRHALPLYVLHQPLILAVLGIVL